ncbi:unnamed protein product [Ranitomeya imitator]|uniref:Integrin alpha-2 domain-containing protein n=1 Tax=Ranitomeya imitator TaxID=111125 RepID=A0ABN9MP96_9NEOB|nr:unnamed protein product [Ranitomeya imitator]
MICLDSDSEELEGTFSDNEVLLDFNLKYESDLLFTRYSSLDQYEITSQGSSDRYNAIGPPFNWTFKANDVTIKITIPVATRGGNRLLLLQELVNDQMNFRSVSLVSFAVLQRKFHSPFIFREEEPSRQITFEISKQEEWEVPIWIIIISTIGGLLLLALLVLALWKVSRCHAEASLLSYMKL